MSRLLLSLEGDRRTFRPGEIVSGQVGWNLARHPAAVVLRLFWRTSGRGTSDLTVVDEVRFHGAASEDHHPFQFTLPVQPYSFSGKLISLVWGLELRAEPIDVSAHEYITVSPSGCEITLPAMEEDAGRQR